MNPLKRARSWLVESWKAPLALGGNLWADCVLLTVVLGAGDCKGKGEFSLRPKLVLVRRIALEGDLDDDEIPHPSKRKTGNRSQSR